jgi:uncharacterized protein YdeI (YjbR/CyaY-like superfamily)
MNTKVDFFFNKAKQWQEELKLMRTIALDCQLSEDLKWGCPCYTFGKSNIVLIHAFKDYCAYLFFKGALMKDPSDILIPQTENVQSARQVRFTSVDQVVELAPILKDYIYQAVEIEEKGLKVELKKVAEYKMPEEFQATLDHDANLKTAFYALTPGRQRAYLLHFSSPKQAKTREARIEKCTPLILGGKGLND